MKYIYRVTLSRGSISSSEIMISENCSNYIRAMEAAFAAMEYADLYGYASKCCFNEIYNVAGWFRKDEGYVRAWKAITNDIYVIHLDKVKMDNRFIERWL